MKTDVMKNVRAFAKKLIPQKIQNAYNSLSEKTREDLGLLFALPLILPVMVPLLMVFAGPAMTLPTAILTVMFAGGMIAVATLISLPQCIQDLKHGKDVTVWENEAGQTVQSSLVEKKDLRFAQESILSLDGQKHIEALTKKFQPAADRVTIVQDIEGGNGRFRFVKKVSSLAPI